MKRFLVLAFLFACAKPVPSGGSRFAMLGGGGEVVTLLDTPATAMLHIVFVPELSAPPGGGYGTGASGGVGRERGEVVYSYDDSTGVHLSSRPVVIIDNKFVECGTRRFDLALGNPFLVHVTRDGRTSAMQLRQTVREKSEPAAVLAIVQKASPNDRWLQALKPAGT